MGTLTKQLCPDKMTNCHEHSEPSALFCKTKTKVNYHSYQQLQKTCPIKKSHVYNAIAP